MSGDFIPDHIEDEDLRGELTREDAKSIVNGIREIIGAVAGDSDE